MISIIIAFRLPSKESCTEEQVDTVESVFSYWSELGSNDNIDLVFIDDHSDDFWINESFIHRMKGAKIDWNMGAARNYAVELARGDKILFTDIDHLVYGNFNHLDSLDLKNCYLKFERLAFDSREFHPMKHHTNSFIMNKHEFIRYDEDFGGNYGYEDTEFFHRLDQTHSLLFVPKNVLFTSVMKFPRVKLNRDKTLNKEKLFLRTGKSS